MPRLIGGLTVLFTAVYWSLANLLLIVALGIELDIFEYVAMHLVLIGAAFFTSIFPRNIEGSRRPTEVKDFGSVRPRQKPPGCYKR